LGNFRIIICYKKKLYVKDIPGRELQLDVSFPYGYQRKLAVYTAIDDASRFIISKIYTNHTDISTLDFVKEPLKNNPSPSATLWVLP
jgi:hypothetical protein